VAGNALGLGQQEVEQPTLDRVPHVLLLREPLLVLLGRDALAELDKGELTDLPGASNAPSATECGMRQSVVGGMRDGDCGLTAGFAPLVAISNRDGTHRASV
jgi:hypothetical protein